MKHLVGKTLTEKAPFMGDEVEVRMLSVGEIFNLQKAINKAAESDDPKSQVALLREIIKVAVVGAEELTNAEFDGFPIGELNKLSETIMAVSGLGGGSEGN
jgi:hypothetical protein